MEEEATATEIAFGAKAALHPPISHFPLNFFERVQRRNCPREKRGRRCSVRYRKGGGAKVHSTHRFFFFLFYRPVTGSQKSRGDSAVMGGAMVWVTSRGCWKGGSTVGQVWQCTSFSFAPAPLYCDTFGRSAAKDRQSRGRGKERGAGGSCIWAAAAIKLS